MDRRSFVISSVGLLAAAVPAWSQPGPKVYHVGVLSPFSSSFDAPTSFEAFRQTLHELGYVEGRNVAFEHRWAEERFERLSVLADELVRLRPDLLVSVWGTPTALASKRATHTVPIVFNGVGDAVGVNLVASLARPGGNVTGSTFITEQTIGKQLQLLKEILPNISRVGAVINPVNPVYTPVLKASQTPARELGIRLIEVNVERVQDFEAAVRAAVKARVEGLVVLRDPVLIANQSRLVALLAEMRLPAMYGVRDCVDIGGLMSYGPSLTEMYRRAAHLADKILKGAKPATLPVEQSTTFELVINLKTAKALGLTIPPSLLLRADQVIE
jgi:putative ABC transport system substrate-binding protein